MTDKPQFEYLLNAMEAAATSKNPAREHFSQKRDAVLKYVAELEARVGPVRSSIAIAAEDPEFYAMRTIVNALNGLDDAGRSRVVEYAVDRFGVDR